MRVSIGLATLALIVASLLPARAGTPGVWQKIANPAPVVGLDGQPHSATCSGYPGTDATFSYFVKPGRSSNLLVYFEGGGACWDDLTCNNPFGAGSSSPLQFYSASIDPQLDPSQASGLFADQSGNPVRDWTQVFIPYCTGDVHGGSATRTYQRTGGGSFDIRHRGFDNFMVVMDWVRQNVANPAKVLVAGSSAGGYGASINFPWVQALYPHADFSVLADASQGVTTAGFDFGTPGRSSWNLQFAPGVFGPNPQQLPTPALLGTAARALPQVKAAQFTTNFDLVQVQFYAVMRSAYGPGGSCTSTVVDWNQQMGPQIRDTAATTPNFRHYVAAGSYHTILASPAMYTEKSAGTTFNRWLGSMIAAPGFGGGLWQNLACPTCLQTLPCQ